MNREIDLAALRSAVATGKLHWRRHALERMLERGISREEVRFAILDGELIEDYSSDMPYPSCLVLHTGEKALHVVVALDPHSGICHVITAYRPDAIHFESDLKTRR
jgi:hypothetical protein